MQLARAQSRRPDLVDRSCTLDKGMTAITGGFPSQQSLLHVQRSGQEYVLLIFHLHVMILFSKLTLTLTQRGSSEYGLAIALINFFSGSEQPLLTWLVILEIGIAVPSTKEVAHP